MLDKIIKHKHEEVRQRKASTPIQELKQRSLFERTAFNFKSALQNSDLGLIAEFKRKSPSKGILNNNADILKITNGYQSAGATALSILTDEHFFSGKDEDIIHVREQIRIPILRKDFIIDVYQIFEAKSIGTDAILLLANVLTKEEILNFTNIAHDLGLQVLLELREETEIEKINTAVDIIGVNNRNLKNFDVDLNQSTLFEKLLPKEKIKISESGINSVSDIIKLKQHNYNGFLVGEHFMKTEFPELTCKKLIDDFNKTK